MARSKRKTSLHIVLHPDGGGADIRLTWSDADEHDKRTANRRMIAELSSIPGFEWLQSTWALLGPAVSPLPVRVFDVRLKMSEGSAVLTVAPPHVEGQEYGPVVGSVTAINRDDAYAQLLVGVVGVNGSPVLVPQKGVV